MPLVSLDRISVAFGYLPLLDEVSLQIEPREHVCVIGRNGTGKSTLLRVLAGDLAPDRGSIWLRPGLRRARLEQDVPLSSDLTVFDAVAEGLGEIRTLVADYHRAAVGVAANPSPELLEVLGGLQHELEERDGWRVEQRVELVLSKLELDADAVVSALSGGWRRRVLLARALVAEPDVLLLDEPSLGLAPRVVDSVFETLGSIRADGGVAVLLVEQRAQRTIELADRSYVIANGELRLTLGPEDAADTDRLVHAYLA